MTFADYQFINTAIGAFVVIGATWYIFK